jgi:sugar O-acyltransferase (sialic acid O-acetyltransferase NeuD family)
MKVVCIVLGGGGHARVLINSMLVSEAAFTYGVLDADRSLWGQNVFGVPILGNDDLLPELIEQGVNHFVVGLGSVGSNTLRARLFSVGLSWSLKPLTVRHPSTICSQWAEVGAGSQLMPGSIINAGAKLGVNVIINSGALVEHGCIIGAHAHIATGAKLLGDVRVGAGAHIGAGAAVRQGLSIGNNSIVGMGAVVLRDVPPRTIMIGVPARKLREVDEEGLVDLQSGEIED